MEVPTVINSVVWNVLVLSNSFKVPYYNNEIVLNRNLYFYIVLHKFNMTNDNWDKIDSRSKSTWKNIELLQIL